MSTQIQRRRGTTAEHASFTGALAETTIDTDKDTVVVHDGSTVGGNPLMREDGANSALALGSAGTPSLKFTGDPNTGIYSPGADQVAVSTGGTEKARIDTSGRLLLGTSTSPSSGNGQFAPLVVQGYIGGSTSLAYLSLQRGEAASSITADEGLGAITFGDNAGNTFAQVAAAADGTAGSGDYPGRLTLSTTADGASSPTERMRIGQNGSFDMPGVYNNTTASAANVFVASGGSMARSTSSAKYKTDIETIQDVYADALLNCRPVWYRSTCEADNPSFSYWGFIAEEVAAIDPRLVHWKTLEITYDENGSLVKTPCEPEPEGVAYDRFVPHLLNLIKRQGEAIADLQAEVSALKGA
jgi:hypothetical protein